MTVSESSLNIETLSQRIYSIRSLNVILDADLAELYGVTTKRLNEQVKRNLDRFPPDFMFQLDDEEHAILRSQIATSNTGRGGRRYLPYAFTEHGAIMAHGPELSQSHRNERFCCTYFRPSTRNVIGSQGIGRETECTGTHRIHP